MKFLVAAASLCATSVAAVPEAHAEGPVSGDGKGIVGGALLGAEIVTITLGIIGVEEVWPYLVFGAVGAGAGGVGGFFVENADPPAEAPLYMLAGGMALVIPALIVTLNATAYNPPDPESDDADPVDNQPGAPGGEVEFEVGAKAPPSHLRVSAVDYHDGTLSVGVPAVMLAPRFSREQVQEFGVEQSTEVRVPILQASF